MKAIKANKLSLLSLLALLGLLGLMKGNSDMVSFLGFIYFIRYIFVTPDELFMENMRRAASTGFFTGIGATGLAMAVHIILPDLLSPSVVAVSGFVVSMFCFIIALILLELRERRGN